MIQPIVYEENCQIPWSPIWKEHILQRDGLRNILAANLTKTYCMVVRVMVALGICIQHVQMAYNTMFKYFSFTLRSVNTQDRRLL